MSKILVLIRNIIILNILIVYTPIHSYDITIICSVYKGGPFITSFMKQIVGQTIFSDCQLWMVDAASPDHEYEAIFPYLTTYNNIHYVRLAQDPGLYGVWNYVIERTNSPYIVNANLDDVLDPTCYEIYRDVLDAHPSIDLVYSDYYLTKCYYPSFASALKTDLITMPGFCKKNMRICIPNNHPMWRRSLHERWGLFDTSYTISGDWEMWLRAVAGGAQFIRVARPLCAAYKNPNGLSTGNKNQQLKRDEDAHIIAQYAFLWH